MQSRSPSWLSSASRCRSWRFFPRSSRLAPSVSLVIALALASPARLMPQPMHPPSAPASTAIQKELRLGGDYLIGRGVPRDPAQSAYWYQQAADHGDPGAQNQMGYFCLWGIGVPRDEAAALKWFARATAAGSQAARLNLAVMVLRGQGTGRDLALAVDLISGLAQRGNARAQDYLGILYARGVGVPRDSAVAETWFLKAAKAHNPEGQYAMGTLLAFTSGHKRNLSKAAKDFRSSARAGYVPAMFALGILLEQHPEIKPARPGEAPSLLEHAAEAGSWQSSIALAFLARDGREHPHDLAAAFRWFTIAARQGGELAAAHTRSGLDACRAVLTPEQQDRELQAAELWLAAHPHTDLFFFSDAARSPWPIDEVYAPQPGAE